MNAPIRKLVVVGGGSAGLISALSIHRRNPEIKIAVVRSAEIPTIGVGESTIHTVPKYLHGYLGIDPAEFFREVEPTWKLGIRFLWGSRERFHYSFRPQMTERCKFLSKPIGFHYGDQFEYGELASSLCASDRVFARRADGSAAVGRDWAYHFDNAQLIQFLESHAARQGIELIDDTVDRVAFDEQGVSELFLRDRGSLAADFFVDCSGFRSLLIGDTFQQPWHGFDQSLYCDRALVANWPRESGSPIKPYTTAETMDAGWCWQIDHESHISRGYVYSSSFISDEAAEAEFRQKNPMAGDSRVIRFASGRRCKPWVRNVVAIGNANGFVEPLESTALHVLCNDAKAVAESIRDCGGAPPESVADAFNRRSEQTWEAIRGFLAIHYKFNTRLDTPFWRACRADVDLGAATPIVKYYQQNGPSDLWHETLASPHDLFGLDGYYTMLFGMQVPFERTFSPSPRDEQLFDEFQRWHRKLAENGVSSEEALAMVRSPAWQWPKETFLP